jgi:hypothetical protein
MFPNIPISVIEQELRQTGSIDAVCERLLRYPVTSTSSNVTAKVSSPNIDFNSPIQEPAKEWSTSSKDREANLRLRKEYMIKKARQKFLSNNN